jgi:hypothetical protein
LAQWQAGRPQRLNTQKPFQTVISFILIIMAEEDASIEIMAELLYAK